MHQANMDKSLTDIPSFEAERLDAHAAGLDPDQPISLSVVEHPESSSPPGEIGVGAFRSIGRPPHHEIMWYFSKRYASTLVVLLNLIVPQSSH